MRLTDQENLAESGIDIVCSPPGKRLQNVLLLSGGEKALAAVALLMAIFRYQPSPFCVMDEVDAPLDESNIGRLTRLLQEMSAQTQFIVITHSKRTMEAAQALYGVTMQEPGVSPPGVGEVQRGGSGGVGRPASLQTADARREDRRAHRFRLPAEEKLDRAAAHAALAGTHAAAGLELGFAPSGIGADAAERHVLTAADQRRVACQRLEFLPQGEGTFQGGGEFPG